MRKTIITVAIAAAALLGAAPAAFADTTANGGLLGGGLLGLPIGNLFGNQVPVGSPIGNQVGSVSGGSNTGTAIGSPIGSGGGYGGWWYPYGGSGGTGDTATANNSAYQYGWGGSTPSSSGLLGGNNVQFPINLPIHACGIAVGPLGLGGGGLGSCDANH